VVRWYFEIDILTASISLITALTMGHIMAVPAEFDIHSPMKTLTLINPTNNLQEQIQKFAR